MRNSALIDPANILRFEISPQFTDRQIQSRESSFSGKNILSGNMLNGLLSDVLGWILVDEAGHATPQAAVGAMMRTRRAVIVGDPWRFWI